jgi:hypothetical protein
MKGNVFGRLLIPVDIFSAKVHEVSSGFCEEPMTISEYEIDIVFTSLLITTINSCAESTATIKSGCKMCAKAIYESLDKAKRKNCRVVLNAACMWPNETGGIHLHDCVLDTMK